MSDERKKVEPKPIVKVEPKKRASNTVIETVKQTPKKLVTSELETKVEPKSEEQTEPKTKRSENKYVRLALDAKGELKYAHYATDNDKGYHYYLVIKKQK
jgi:hypothetical protein